MRGSKILISGILGVAALSASSPTWADTFEPGMAASAVQYANETNLNTRLDASVSWKSETKLEENSLIPARELHLTMFYESGALGDKSIDVDPAVVRFGLGESSHLWLGRNHPLLEGTVNEKISSTEAIGANWVQNQSNALEPSVTGWIGTGIHFEDQASKISGTIAYSPIFLPSFGPRVTLDEINEASASRFGNLPPQYYNVNGIWVPMRYHVNIGNLKDIVVQNQFFGSMDLKGKGGDLTLMGWSAPSPKPQVNTIGQINPIPNLNAANVLVTATPNFPREYFAGARWKGTGVLFSPMVEGVYEAVSQRFTFSAKVQPLSFFETGVLHTWYRPQPPSDGPTVESPDYNQHLVWSQFNFTGPGAKVAPSLRFEGHFTPGEEGYWIHPMLHYQADSRMRLYASVNLIGGQDRGYFGNWQSLDSVAVGAVYAW